MKTRTLIISLIILITVIIISIIYTTIPRLELNGVQNMTISYRETYEEPGVILKNANTKYLNRLKIEDNIEPKKLGIYHVDYTLKLGTRTLKRRRNIKVIDDISPTIKLDGNQIMKISINKEYIEPGYKATDEYDGDITENVEVTGKVDTTNYGEYIIKYKVKDSNNNTTEINRIVKVIDEKAPEIICESNYSPFKKEEENVIGCKAIDNYDGDITNKIKVIGNYDTKTPGTYNIQYTVEDDSGNKTTINHDIIIYEDIERTAYIVINDDEMLKEILTKKEIPATIINPIEQTEEYINELKKQNYQTELKINNNKFNNIKEVKHFCENNQIKYMNLNKNIIDEKTQEIVNNKNEKTIINLTEEKDIKELKKIITLLIESNYQFDIIENIK